MSRAPFYSGQPTQQGYGYDTPQQPPLTYPQHPQQPQYGQGYAPPPQGYAPQQGYAPPPQGYAPQQGYAPPPQAYPQQPQAYPPRPQQQAYPPQQAYPQQPQTYPQQPQAYPPRPPQQQAYPSAPQAYPQPPQMYPPQPAPGFMAQEKKQAAIGAFRAQDLDRSGFVDQREFYQALSMLGLGISWADSCVIFSIVDGNGNGQISESEFVDYYLANF